ncbi:transposase [Arthrobacter sp. A5]|uniref:transposase n=1 Tax=Arthrobacter sp. A5 TaxID=576926 RepID=UPI003DA950EC
MVIRCPVFVDQVSRHRFRGERLAKYAPPGRQRQRAHRAAAREEGLQHDYRAYRPLAERSIGWVVAGGNRRLRYLGVEKNHIWLQERVAARNLRRLLKRGLTGQNGACPARTHDPADAKSHNRLPSPQKTLTRKYPKPEKRAPASHPRSGKTSQQRNPRTRITTCSAHY